MNKKGFTLIELLVSSAVFLAAVVAFGYLLRVGMISTENSEQMHHALALIRSEAEEARALPFSALSALNGSSFADKRGKISVLPVLSDLSLITFELTWDPDKVPIKTTTLRSACD